jgi:hypothetical protein
MNLNPRYVIRLLMSGAITMTAFLSLMIVAQEGLPTGALVLTAPAMAAMLMGAVLIIATRPR